MKRFFTVMFGLLLAVAGSSVVWADGITGVVSATTTPQDTRTVFNDSGGALTSYSLVVWDNDDTEFDRNGYPYVTTTTTGDSPWLAGVTQNASCADQTLCTVVTYGWSWVRVADSTDAAIEDTLISSSTVAGQAGDYTAAANTCALGRVAELYNKESGTDTGVNGQVFPVFVDIDCQ